MSHCNGRAFQTRCLQYSCLSLSLYRCYFFVYLSFLIASLSACWCVSQSFTGLEFYLLQHMTSYSLVTQSASFLFPLNLLNSLLHARVCNSLWITSYSSDTEQRNQALRLGLHFLLYKLSRLFMDVPWRFGERCVLLCCLLKRKKGFCLAFY